ncbi:MAG: hypothetical protein JWM32_2760 [Verrucomicrobia bacterium]|nr:hypothetical protein [Verrucomicrobiota bacterium]
MLKLHLTKGLNPLGSIRPATPILVFILCLLSVPNSQAVGTVTKVVCCQAGYSAGDCKVAHVIATDVLTTPTYQVLNGTTVVASGTMTDEGVAWGSRVYSVDFSSVTATGTNFTVKSNTVSSYTFPIQTNMWDSYKDEMTAFYRMQRTFDTTLSCPSGYSTVSPSAKAFHPDSFMDDAISQNLATHYDLTGGWYDAGDYGKYGGNQWVQGEIALAYLRHASSAAINYDYDANGIPDLLDEAKYGCEYIIKYATLFNGALYDLGNPGGWKHPELYTDGIASSPTGAIDDRKLGQLCVGGSAKAAGALAATARAINWALANNKIAAGKIVEMQAFSASCASAAVTCYNYAINNQTGNLGSYTPELTNCLLWAEVELYLLTNTTSYKTAATNRITPLTSLDLPTNYWDLKPMTLVEFYPVADASVQTQIQGLLKKEMDYFMSLADDTAYGVLNQLGTFGVNEPHLSYVGDAIRYYELFADPAVLRAALKGIYWVCGDNPWNKSWVSGLGTDYTAFIHTRLNASAYTHTDTGIVLPGAMVGGPNVVDPTDKNSASPWYVDRPIWQDDINQWRYQEHSISIEAGLVYSITGLIALNGSSSSGGTTPPMIKITSPTIGDFVTGDVDIFVRPLANFSAVEYKGTAYTAMTAENGVYTATVNVGADIPYANKRYTVRGTDASGNMSFSAVHFRVAPPLPSPTVPLLYDDFGHGGVWGTQNLGWVNWYNDQGGIGTYALTTVDARSVGRFTQNPSIIASQAKFEPWHDYIDLTGYRYLTFVMKNPGYPNSRIKANLNDGVSTYALSAGLVNVPTTWTTYSFDLNQFAGLNKSKIHLELWLKQTAVTYGEMLIDDISATNVASGVAPTISATSLNNLTGDEKTVFTFNATYTDADNQKPYRMQLVIDGIIRDLNEVDAADVVYTDGKLYTYATTLPLGAHSYYYRTTDTTSSVVATTVQSGPLVDGYEIENLPVNVASSGDTHTIFTDSTASGGKYDRFNANAATDYIEYKTNVPVPGTYAVKVLIRKGNDRGIYQLAIDGVNQGSSFDAYAATAAYVEVDCGTVVFTTAGTKMFRFTCLGKNASSGAYKLYGDSIALDVP